MKLKQFKNLLCSLAGLAILLSIAASPVPDSEMATLESELSAVGNGKSAVESRMSCKSLIRKGKAILEANPEAPNRFRVLGIVLQAQKRLFGLENSDRNRSELFETSQQLAKAPDEYAELRLEADLLLSDRDLSAKDAGLPERVEALTALIERYRGTPAEAKSLMMAALIAPKLEADDLQEEIIETLSERFSDNPSVIEFIQKNLGIRRLDVLLNGTFTRVDGTEIRFPFDRMGHLTLMVFWSRESPGFEKYLKQVKEQQALYADRLAIYSFNLDSLPDAGEEILRGLELNWTAMRLPGGKKNQAYQTYAQKDPIVILVNAFGHAILNPTVVRQEVFKIDDVRISHDQYLAQLQSLFIGDFLVVDSISPFDPSRPPELKMISSRPEAQPTPGLNRTPKSVPEDTLRAIQACFVPPPFRYRLKPADALANYTKAEKLCSDAMAQHPDAPDLWIVRNRRIISLMGMWSLAGEPKYLEQAAKESRASLTADLPAAAGVVPRFCLAKQSLREGTTKPETVLPAMIQESGADAAPASALAAAAILALDAQSKELHDRYRSKFMEAPYDGNPVLWSFISFLRDRYHRYQLFRGNYIRSEDRGVRSYVVNHGLTPMTDRLPDIELKTLDGKTLNLPKDTNGQLTLLLFIEPPDVVKNEVELDAKGKPKKRSRDSIMDHALRLAERHVNKELKVVGAFLCDDPGKVKAMMEANEWNCDAVMVPGGLANPMVQQLGILSSDRLANIFLIRRDGTIAWQSSGFLFKSEFGGEFSRYLGMKVHTEVCEAQTGYEALQQGDFKRAASVFSGPFPPDGQERFQWAGPQFHGRALANIGLKNWDAALVDIDAAIKAHHGGDAKTGPCEIMADMHLTRGIILDQLGRKDEAEAERKLAAAPTVTHPKSIYDVFQSKLVALRRDQR